MSPSITLHHLNTSRSERIFWVLEELGLPYNVKVYFRTPAGGAPPSLKQISPFGKAPVLELDGEIITESAYIIHRLLQLVPDNKDVETIPSDDSVFWGHFAEGSQMNLFQAGAIIGATGAAWKGGMVGGLGEEGKEGVAKYTQWLLEGYLKPQNQTNLDQIEDFLAKHKGSYFSGSDKPGLGDFMLLFAFNSILAGSRKSAGYTVGPASHEWYGRVSQRPALQKAMQRLKDEEAAAKANL